MGDKTIGLTDRELKNFSLDVPESVELILHAQESDAADRKLTIRQALAKYPKAVFWAMFLSTSLIMEGYDVVIVSSVIIFLFIYSWKQTRLNEILIPLLTDHIVLRSIPISKALRNI